MNDNAALVEYLLRIGDDRLVLGHRLSEWCGHGPVLEEDIALTNIALDLVGQASALLGLAGQLEGQGRDADQLAYFREAIAYRNLLLVEQPNGDFGQTIARQFLFDAYDLLLLEGLAQSSHETLAGIAGKALKEARYHLRHSSEWVLRLGAGTAESHSRLTAGFEAVWSYTEEIFSSDAVDRQLAAAGIVPDVATLAPRWRQLVGDLLTRATLTIPGDDRYMQRGGRQGRHSERLGYLLAEMQIVARSFPGASW